MEDYIKKVRKKFGHDELILNYAGCIIFDNKTDCFCKNAPIVRNGDFSAEW